MHWFEVISATWNVIEPGIWIIGAISALIYFLKVRRAKKRRYCNSGEKDFILALQVGRPVSEAVKSHFGELDCLIDIGGILGKCQLDSPGDFKKLAQEVYRAMSQNQNCPIKLVLSGPVGLSFLVGQLVGLAKFDVTIYQFDPQTKGYQALPVPDRNWL